MAASPTLRRRRLARQLLTLRASKGFTVEAVATEAKKRSPDRPWSAAKVTRIENRKLQRLRQADLLTLLDIYGVIDEEKRAAYVKLAKEASQSGWWVGYRDVLGTGAYIDLETEATELRTYEALYVPGLLQTPDYAEALVRGSGITDEHQITRRVEARMMRKQILERPDAPVFSALIDEAALRKIPGEIASGQLRHLIAVQRPTVQVRIVPDSVGPHLAMNGAFVVMRFPHDPSAVFLEQSIAGMFLEDSQELEHYERVFAAVEEVALSVEDSVAFLEASLKSSK
ncbi:helix-turn-helix domain-containing protein [Actinorugispora endophytica]|uniref:Helix-turn-helix protein n=1 Tax=Actinorugispora endophytica TaxID=1605990 RepID=A0A4R6UQN1_9ACTN|nr:helix-turn-helix transcriptional regulator [Actinorugispora endophytica]TDQ49262.1 helix-turn-helix protein [Actinorugispora endophytica]